MAGTFDFLHIGHQYLLWNAVNSANSMTVIVARDENVLRIKGKRPHFTQEQRIDRISREFLPNTNIKLGGESLDEFFQTLADEKPDAIILGYDQQIRFPVKKIEELGIEIVRQNSFHPEFFKSSYFRYNKKDTNKHGKNKKNTLPKSK